MTARMVSRFRPPVDIVGLTTSEKTWRKLALSWGESFPPCVSSMSPPTCCSIPPKKVTQEVMGLQKGDKIVITGGMVNGRTGNTNMLKIETGLRRQY